MPCLPCETRCSGREWSVPDPTVDEVRTLLTETATLEGERKLAVIHPQSAFGRLSTRAKK